MNLQKATFAGGCFWCTEAIFQAVKGVESVTSGYTGGKLDNPTYMEICNDDTGHAEAIEIIFDADTVNFDDLLLIFFKTHNPTMVNKQGNDAGTQYRSAVYYHNDEQKQKTQDMVQELIDEKIYDKPIVTQIQPADKFYKAEDYHQNYFQSNVMKPYCQFVIQPKFTKFAREFTDKIKARYL